MIPDPFAFNLRHLAAVPVIAARGRLHAAAEAVHLSQPALTQGLAKLEAQFGRALFERRLEGMVPTAAGESLAVRVRLAFAHLAEASRQKGHGAVRPERRLTAAQLRAFLALADTGSFVAAAARIGLSEPACHRAVRELEQILAVPLAVRQGRGVHLTEAGRRMGRGTRLAAAELRAAIAELSLAEPFSGAGRIVIGAMPLCRARLLPQALVRLQAAWPGMRATVVEGSWPELVEQLRDGLVDFTVGALRGAAAGPDLVESALFEDRLQIICRPGHALAGPVLPPRDALAGFAWVVGREGSPWRHLWEGLFTGRSLPPHPIECGSVITLREILRATDHLTLLSPDQLGPELGSGMLATCGPPLASCVRQIGVTVRARFRPTAWQAAFVAGLRALCAERELPDSE